MTSLRTTRKAAVDMRVDSGLFFLAYHNQRQAFCHGDWFYATPIKEIPMAQDWIKIREDLHEDPAVLAIARRIKERPEMVVGYCVRFWGWVSRNTATGYVYDVTLDDIESVLGMPHFLHHLVSVGWLEVIEDTSGCCISIPKFERHMSESAKKRALKSQQRTRQRDAKRVAEMGDKSATKRRPEKRREEKSTNTLTSISRTPPTVEQVRAYFLDREYQDDSEAFHDYYTSNGWKVGKNPMRDWKAAVRNWAKRNKPKDTKSAIEAWREKYADE